jgi:hypothetical protein
MPRGESFNWVVNGRLMHVFQQWRSCGHKRTKDGQYRCNKCYPGTGQIERSHGPYYFAYYRDPETGKWKRVYIGRELPPQNGLKGA